MGFRTQENLELSLYVHALPSACRAPLHAEKAALARRLRKPIRPVFMVYSNNIFRLLEYEFTDLRYYNSLRLVQERNYSLEEIEITLDDLYDVWTRTKVKPEPPVTFIQADSFYKVISLVERLNENPMTGGEIAQLFGFKERQSDYYFNACRYLGLAEKLANNNAPAMVAAE